MTRTVKVKHNFWDNDFCGQKGFDNICSRLKDSKKMCSDLIEFLKERARIEETYSRSLKKLSQHGGGLSELGTMKISYDNFLTQTGRIAESHSEAAQQMTQSLDRVNALMETQNSKRKDATERVKSSIEDKKSLYGKVNRARKSYEDKCKQCGVLASQKESLKMSPAANPKEVDKVSKNFSKAMTDQQKLDSEYQDLVNKLENSRRVWENEMNKLCDTVEELEEDKVNNLRNEMWVVTNIISQVCVMDDEYCEEIRQSLEKCDPGKDIMQFIEEKKTGSSPPGAIVYQKCGNRPPGGGMGRQGQPPQAYGRSRPSFEEPYYQ